MRIGGMPVFPYYLEQTLKDVCIRQSNRIIGYICKRNMAKYVKVIGLLLLTFALWQVGNAPVGNASDGVENAVDIQSASAEYAQEEACFTNPQLPYLPDAELASAGGHIQWLTPSRVQRSNTIQYLFSLKDRVEKLARYEAALSLHREKLYDAAAHYPCQPVCEYYIFTLRRILI